MLRPRAEERRRHGGASPPSPAEPVLSSECKLLALPAVPAKEPDAMAAMAAAHVRWCGRRLTLLLRWAFALTVATWCVSLLRSKGSPPAQVAVNPLEALVLADEARMEPEAGAMGEAAALPPDLAEEGDLAYKRIALNEPLSDIIPYNRTLADYRDPKCAFVHYDEDLPSASVIIVFFDEPYSVIIRTVWSVLNTGGKHVQEVILVDDSSTLPELGAKLDYYILTRLPKHRIKVVRLKERSGLIRARLAGARVAHGDVLVFLDAHCEAVVDWLRPLLQRIKDERKAVLVPIIDVIDSNNFYYSTSGYSFQVGGFIFSGHFTWIPISESELRRRESDIAPARSPTMAGGLFAIDRNYFWEVGSYDEQMDGWGGENLEMSFRIWQCGGILETIPCSRVGHVFREFHPYKFPNDQDTHGINTARLALVWMDEYAKYFFSHRKDLENIPEIGDITHRKILREKLHCKSFDWYLKNVYPEKFVPGVNVTGYGRVKNPYSGLCIDLLGREEQALAALGVYGCHPELHYSQYMSLTLTGELRTEEKCAMLQYRRDSPEARVVIMSDCHGKKKDQEWKLLKTNQIRHVQTKTCLDAKGLSTGDDLVTTACDKKSKTQKWFIEFNEDNKFGELPSSFDESDIFDSYMDNSNSYSRSKVFHKIFGLRNKKLETNEVDNSDNILPKPKSFPGQFRVPAFEHFESKSNQIS